MPVVTVTNPVRCGVQQRNVGAPAARDGSLQESGEFALCEVVRTFGISIQQVSLRIHESFELVLDGCTVPQENQDMLC